MVLLLVVSLLFEVGVFFNLHGVGGHRFNTCSVLVGVGSVVVGSHVGGSVGGGVGSCNGVRVHTGPGVGGVGVGGGVGCVGSRVRAT